MTATAADPPKAVMATVAFEVELTDAKALYSLVKSRHLAANVSLQEVEEWIGTAERPNLLACIRLALDHGGSPSGLSIHDSSAEWAAPKQRASVHACRKCGSALESGYCSDSTCVYNDWPQCLPAAELENNPTAALEAKYGVRKRLHVEQGVAVD
ncbi:MAG: hypothetical protein O9327_01955 [Polaromonas sp.]|nr:hypothetical protein [Polaromonas sp.]